MQYTLRPMNEGDIPFLHRLYATTRQAEMAMVDWSSGQKEEFVRMQFEAQHSHYMKVYAQATFDIIESGNIPVGRLYLDERTDEIRIVDIALLPEFCGKGLGTTILQQILCRAADRGVAVRIHVEQFNPALRLYGRLGFTKVDTNGVYHLMEYVPRQEKKCLKH